MVVLTVARMPVGIDVECERQNLDCQALAQGVFTSRERTIVGAGSDAQERLAFFAMWTRKEAYVKGTGQGSNVPLAELDTGETPFAPAPYPILQDSSPPTWFATPLPSPPGYVACLATPCERPGIVMCDE